MTHFEFGTQELRNWVARRGEDREARRIAFNLFARFAASRAISFPPFLSSK